MEDKFKIVRSAEKLVIKGQVGKAVSEYKKLLDQFGEDPSVLNTLGDLLLKHGRRDEAISYFRRVGEMFSQSGFVSKAIGVYRKIDRIAPPDREIHSTMAKLYKRRGLSSEARRYLQKVVDDARRTGDDQVALEKLKEITEIDSSRPKNFHDYAELLVANDRASEAVEQFLIAARLYRGEEAHQNVYDCAQEALKLDGNSEEAMELMLEAGENLSPDEGAREFVEDDLEELLGDSDLSPEDLDSLDEEDRKARELEEGDVEIESSGGQILEDSDDDEIEVEEAFDLGTFEEEDQLRDEGEAESKSSDEEQETPSWHPMVEEPDEVLVEADQQAEPVELDEEELSLDSIGEEVEEAEDEIEEDRLAEEDSEDSEDLSLGLDDEDSLEIELEAPSEDESVELSTEADEDRVGEDSEAIADVLQEAEFYEKLDLQEDAHRLVAELLERYPENEQVIAKARSWGVIEEESEEADSEEESTSDEESQKAVDSFESQVDTALEDLFLGEELSEISEEELPEKLEEKEAEVKNDPKSLYDLGLAYREMGMLDDAVEKFEESFELVSEEDGKQAVLAATMLTSSYLQMNDYKKTIEWAEMGLELPETEGFEWKALEYDRSQAFELLGDFEASLEGYERIHEQDAGFRDVESRISRIRLLSE